jgi:lysophospholipase L1-like esterase
MSFAIAPFTSIGGDTVAPSEAYAYEFLDSIGQAALIIDRDGALLLPSSDPFKPNVVEPTSSGEVFQFCDTEDRCAMEVLADGTVRIASLEVGELINLGEIGSAPVDEAAWNETNGFWAGYAPSSAVTSSYDRIFAGSATTAEADDFAMRQNYWCQREGDSVRVYFDHSSDHVSSIWPGGSSFIGAPNMQIAFGIGGASSHVAGAVPTHVRGTINGQRRPTVAPQFFGWSDPVRFRVEKDTYVAVTTTQNIIGTYRLSGGAGATGLSTGAARSGGFLATPAGRWGAGASAPALVLDTGAADLDGCAGVRFIAVKAPIDRMIAVVSDSIARGIVFTTQPAPRSWPMLLDLGLRSESIRSAVWHQGSGGGRANAMAVNSRYLDRIVNCTHMVIALGSNDLADGLTAVRLQADVSTIASAARQAGAKVILATVLPRNPFTSAQNIERTSFNTWVRTNPFDGVVDFDLALRDTGAINTLFAAFNGGDGIHPNDAGHAAMYSSINPLVFA